MATDRIDLLLIHRPDPLIDPDETGAALGEAAREEAVRGKGPVSRNAAVAFERLRVFTAQIDKIGDARLHLESHLILGDAGGDFRIMDEGVALAA